MIICGMDNSEILSALLLRVRPREFCYGVHINKEANKKAVVLMNTSDVNKRVNVLLDGGNSKRFKVYEPFTNPITQLSSRKISVKSARVAVVVEA